MQNNIPQPLFAPSNSSHGQSDDFDLNEIFAEYFSNEFDSDPLNAYTSSMANYSGGASAIAMAQQGGGVVPDLRMAGANPNAGAAAMSLPTGGIRTVFHVGSSSQKQEQQQVVDVTGQGGATGVLAPAPPSKKAKQDSGTAGLVAAPAGLASAPNPLVSITGFTHQGVPVPAGLGASQAEQQQDQQVLAIQGGVASLPNGLGVQQQQQQQQQQQGVQLPVGVGIRLGGIGGIAPVTAQAGAKAPGVLQAHSMWGQIGGVGEPPVSDQAVAERRQRNREHAKRSRVRKKFMLESLQEEVRNLQKENHSLRMIVQEHIPEHAMKIISECCTSNPLFDDADMAMEHDAEEASERKESKLVKTDFSLMESLVTGQQCFVLSDPKLPDNPIVFASAGFYKLTGYKQEEVLGRNCRFLQGPGTDRKAVDVIRKAISSGSDATVCLLNYKSDGTPFWNQFFIAALRDSDNSIVNYVGVQCEIQPDTGANALEDRVNEVLPLQAKDEKGKEQEDDL